MTTVCVNVIPQFSIGVVPTETTICILGKGVDEVANLSVVNISSPAIGQQSSYKYQWYTQLVGGVLTPPNSSAVAVMPSVTTTYTAEVRDSLNCVSLPKFATVSVQICTGLEDNEFNKFVTVFPNPSNGKVYIRTSNPTSLRVTDITGRVMAEFRVDDFGELPLLNPGIYTVECVGKTRVITKLIINR